jgi:ComF family protein
VPLPVCIRCGKDLAESFKNISEPICVECKSEKLYFRYARAVGLYEGVLKESILLFKYKGKTGLGDKLAELMIRSLENIGWCNNIDIIVPVPLHKTRLKERGYNQAELLAIKIGKRFDIPVICNKLQRIKHTNVQTYLRKQDRIDNIKGAFQVNSGEIFCRKTLLLIDDVFTTGATVNECSRVLKQAGAKEIFVFTLARGR